MGEQRAYTELVAQPAHAQQAEQAERYAEMTPLEAQTELNRLSLSARQYLASLVSRAWNEEFSLATALSDLQAMGLALRRFEEDEALGCSLPKPRDGLLDEVTDLYGMKYTLPGMIEVAPSMRLLAMIYALLVGEGYRYPQW